MSDDSLLNILDIGDVTTPHKDGCKTLRATRRAQFRMLHPWRNWDPASVYEPGPDGRRIMIFGCREVGCKAMLTINVDALLEGSAFE